MPSIGKMSIQVLADMGQLLRDLNQLNSNIQQVQKSANRAAQSLRQLAFAGLGFLGGVAIKNAITEAFDFITQAEGLNLTTEAWGRLKLAQMEVGGSTEELARHIQRLETHLGEAQLSADKTQKKFRGFLGLPNEAARNFRNLGLDEQDLDHLPTDEHFRRVSEAVLKLGTAEERFHALQSVFTNVSRGNAPRLLALMQKVVSDWDALGQRSRSFGLFIRPEDIEGIKRGRAALADLSAVWEGLKFQLAAAVAPALAELVDHLTKWLEESGGAGNVINQWVDGFHQMVGDAKDIADTLTVAFHDIREDWLKANIAASKFALIFIKPGGDLAKAHEDRIRAAEATRQAGADARERIRIRATQRDLDRQRKEAEKQQNLFTPHANLSGMGPLFDANRFRQRMVFPVPRLDLPNQVEEEERWRILMRTLNDEGQGFLERFANSINWGRINQHLRILAEQAEKTRSAMRRFADQREIQLWQEQARQIHNEVLPPLEQLAFMLDQIKKAQDIGGLSEADANLKLLKVFTDLEKASGVNQVNLAPAAQFGSAQAASIISNFEVRPSQNLQERIANTLTQMQGYERIMAEVARQVAEFLRKAQVLNGRR